MYSEYWKLTARPFRNTPDPKFYYNSAQHDEALTKMAYAVNENIGGAILTGAYGCGKTLLARILFQELGDSFIAKACFAQPDMMPVDLLRGIARSITGDELPAERSNIMPDALLEIIEKALRENHRDGKHTVVLVDEAHMLDNPPSLEMLRLLLNLQSGDEFLLTLLLIGHIELAERVGALKQLAQRIPLACSLKQFVAAETAKYIAYRLAIAGGGEQIFDDDALNVIHRNSGGIPRRINTLCEISLLLGSHRNVRKINASLVLEAAEKFGAA